MANLMKDKFPEILRDPARRKSLLKDRIGRRKVLMISFYVIAGSQMIIIFLNGFSNGFSSEKIGYGLATIAISLCIYMGFDMEVKHLQTIEYLEEILTGEQTDEPAPGGQSS